MALPVQWAHILTITTLSALLFNLHFSFQADNMARVAHLLWKGVKANVSAKSLFIMEFCGFGVFFCCVLGFF